MQTTFNYLRVNEGAQTFRDVALILKNTVEKTNTHKKSNKNKTEACMDEIERMQNLSDICKTYSKIQQIQT